MSDIDNVEISNVRKLQPKIMICNVNRLEDEDTLMDNLIERNHFLRAEPNFKDKMTKLFKKPASGNTDNHIFKCDPSVRALFRRNYDKVILSWGSYIVRDRFFATRCYFCQNYSHTAVKCSIKSNGGDCVCILL